MRGGNGWACKTIIRTVVRVNQQAARHPIDLGGVDKFDPVTRSCDVSDCGRAGRGACCTVRFWRDDRLDAALFEIVSDCIGIIGLVGKERSRCVLRQIDQRVVDLAVCALRTGPIDCLERAMQNDDDDKKTKACK